MKPWPKRLLGYEISVAEGCWARMRGLIARPPPAPGHALLIPHCNCVHTLFMRYPIDIVFIDAHGNAVRHFRHVPPGRFFVWGSWRACAVLESACM